MKKKESEYYFPHEDGIFKCNTEAARLAVVVREAAGYHLPGHQLRWEGTAPCSAGDPRSSPPACAALASSKAFPGCITQLVTSFSSRDCSCSIQGRLHSEKRRHGKDLLRKLVGL